MATIHEEIVIIRVSRLVKDTQTPITPLDQQTLVALEQVAQELLGVSVVVEVETAQ